MNEEKTYYDQNIWSHFDGQITSSSLFINKFVSKDQNNIISLARLKISINNFQLRVNDYVTLSHQDIFGFIQKFKGYESQLTKICSDISSDQNKQTTFSIKSKKNLIVTFLYRLEYGGPCVRIVISDKTSDYLDSEKIYMSIYDFLSLIMIVGQFRMNYVQIIDSMSNMVMIKNLEEKIDGINNKLENYYSEFIQHKSYQASSEIQNSVTLPTSTFDPFSETITSTENSSSSSSSSSNKKDENINEIYNDMTSFIKEKRDTFDIGINEDIEKKSEPVQKATVITNSFTEKMLLNDVNNLEMYINNLNNTDLPFSKFNELIISKLGFNSLEGITTENKNSLDYLISNYLKHHIKKSLEEKQSLPPNTVPIVIDNVQSNENKISLAYDLFLYSIYYGQLKNILKEKDYGIVNNKELMCFSLKCISAPYIFSIVKSIDEKIVISELINRYRKYKQLGVFDKLEKHLVDSELVLFSLSEETIKTEANRMLTVIIQNWNKFSIQENFKKMSNLVKLNYEDFQNNKFTEEQIKKILGAEFNFKKNGKVNFVESGISSFDDIPISISEKFGIINKKFDNTNLKRFIKDKCKDNEKVLSYCLKISDSVNESYRDLKTLNVDFTLIPEEILKAILLWDLLKDSKIVNNYIYYMDLIKNSSLTKDMIISLLTNIQTANDPDFTKSFLVAREE